MISRNPRERCALPSNVFCASIGSRFLLSKSAVERRVKLTRSVTLSDVGDTAFVREISTVRQPCGLQQRVVYLHPSGLILSLIYRNCVQRAASLIEAVRFFLSAVRWQEFH
jgi:hypothetical protein